MMRVERCRDAAVIAGLQRSIFSECDRVGFSGREWWIVKDTDAKEAVAFAGLREFGTYAFFCLAGVLKKYRGQGLQRRLIKAREKWAREYGKTSCITYTLLNNHKSSNNLIECGYRLYSPEYQWKGAGVLYWRKVL